MALLDQIIGVESGGDPTAKNPNSSASGPGQFIDSTWLEMLKQHRPDITGTPEQLLALKNDPELARQMTAAYAADNQKVLSGAGFEATPGNTYLAHFAGPQGALSVLKADPSTPVAQVLGAKVVSANPFLSNMTVSDLRAWADKKMGGAQSQPASQPQMSQPQQPQAPQNNAAPASQPSSQPTSQMPNISAAPQGDAYMNQFPASFVSMPPPIFFAPRKPVNLAALRAALEAAGNRGPILPTG